MFQRGARFPNPKIQETPVTNSYNSAQDSQLDVNKRGVLLDKPERFAKEKVSDVPAPNTHDTQHRPLEPKHASKGSMKASTSDQCALWRKRTEELDQQLSDNKKMHQVELDRLHFELARQTKSAGEMSERLEKQKRVNESLEGRIQELKKASSSDQAQSKELRLKLRVSEHERAQLSGKQSDAGEFKKVLHALEAKRKEENRDKDKKIADLERALNAELSKKETADVQRDERRRGERAHVAGMSVQQLEIQVKDAQDKAKQAHCALQALISEAGNREQELLSQIEHSRSLVANITEEYGRLASSTVHADVHANLKHRNFELQLRLFRLERKLANVEGQVVELTNLVRSAKDKNHLLSTCCDEAEEELGFYADALEDLTRMSQADLDLADEQKTLQNGYAVVATEIRECQQEDLEARALENEAVAQFQRGFNEELSQFYWSAEKCLDESEALIQQHTITLEAMSITQASLNSQLEAALAERETIRSQYTSVLVSNEELKVTSTGLELRLRQEETKRQQELAEHEKLLKKEHHIVQNLTSTVQKSRMAEESLRAEIEQLTAELKDAERYQQAYYSLSDEVDSLVARHQLAEAEAQRLSKFNAEILGHTNPAQRIMYVDRIRRELADTKHQLLKSTMEHENAVADANALRQELGLYKSVVVDDKPRTNITRIGRRPLADQSINISAILDEQSMNEKIQHVQMLDAIQSDMTLDELSCIS